MRWHYTRLMVEQFNISKFYWAIIRSDFIKLCRFETCYMYVLWWIIHWKNVHPINQAISGEWLWLEIKESHHNYSKIWIICTTILTVIQYELWQDANSLGIVELLRLITFGKWLLRPMARLECTYVIFYIQFMRREEGSEISKMWSRNIWTWTP